MPWIYVLLFSLSAALASYLLTSGGPIEKIWRRHSQHLQRHFSLLFVDTSAPRVAALHMTLTVALLLVAGLVSSLSLLLLVPVVAAFPSLYLDRRQIRKRAALSEQLAAWLTILSNSLKSAPSINDAFEASIGLVDSPLCEEIELLIKEVKMGEHLDRAMHRSAARIESPLYSSVMTTLLVGRQSGGDLPKILGDSSSTLREMERLEGVVRTKTAEGKSQTFVLALLPFVMVAALHNVDPSMLPTLLDSGSGKLILAISIGLWLASIGLALRIVKVDI